MMAKDNKECNLLPTTSAETCRVDDGMQKLNTTELAHGTFTGSEDVEEALTRCVIFLGISRNCEAVL